MGVKKFWFLSKKTSWISATHVGNAKLAVVIWQK